MDGVIQLSAAPAYAMIRHFHPFISPSHKRQLSLVPCSCWCHPTDIPCFLPPSPPPQSSFLSSSLPGPPTPIFVQNILSTFCPKQTITFFVSCFKNYFLSKPCSFTYICIHTLIELQSFDVQHFLFNVCPCQPIAVFFLK